MKLISKAFLVVIIVIFSFSLLGCEEKEEKVTPKDVVEAFKENERQHTKKPSSIKDLPEMKIF